MRKILTYSFIIINTIMLFITFILPKREYLLLLLNYGVIPILIVNGKNLLSLLTSMFLHGDIFHLFMNMYALLLFGGEYEDFFGSFKFSILYFGSGLFAGIFHSFFIVLMFPESSIIPAIGASGAIFGIMAAYAISFPYRKLSILIGLFPVTAPAILIIFGYAFIETIYAISLQTSYIAHSAHIGGFLAGILIGFIFKKIKNQRI
ncbi:MAG: rhomboid family intramembrane serine protease [Nitrososphaerota archaeon]